jgi:prephenate dehydratase
MYGVLKKYPAIKLVEDKIQLKPRRIQEGSIKGIAAIASKTAAKCIVSYYSSEIQTINHNMTRFVILKKQELCKRGNQ